MPTPDLNPASAERIDLPGGWSIEPWDGYGCLRGPTDHCQFGARIAAPWSEVHAFAAAMSPPPATPPEVEGLVTDEMVKAGALAFAKNMHGRDVVEARDPYIWGMRAALEAVLPARIAALESEQVGWEQNARVARNNQIEAEAQRHAMAEALRQIASHSNHGLTNGSPPTRVCLDWCVEAARAALARQFAKPQSGAVPAPGIAGNQGEECKPLIPGSLGENGR